MSVERLVKPRSVAVLGASERASVGRAMIESLERIGFPGAIYPVNPRYPSVAGRTCYPDLRDLPEAPDVVSFCIRNAGVLDALKAAAARGAGAAVIYDGGFAELGEEGRKLQAAIVAICAEAGMALCGPNCMGIINPPARATTFKQDVRDPSGLAGNVAMISQSGSIAATFLSDLRRYGFSLVASTGNEAVTSTARYIEYAIDDPDTKVIATFTESVREPERYVAALDRAAAAGKPVIVLKVGRSERTQRAITGHTGGLAGESRVFTELCRAHRAIPVDDVDELNELIAACQGARWPRGRGINVVTTSGGQAELILDIATAAGLALDPLPAEVREEIERGVGHVTGDGNPLDAWGSGDFRVTMPHALKILSDHAGTDAIVFCSSDCMDNQALGREGREEDYAKVLAGAAALSDKPHYMMSTRPGIMHHGQLEILKAAGIAMVGGTRQALGAIDRLAGWMAPPRARPPAPAPRSGAKLAGAARSINEFDAKALLAPYGIPVARETLVASRAEAARAAAAIGYPVVLKVAADAIPHKSEHGLVAVGLADATALKATFTHMEARVAALGHPIRGFLVQEMVADGVEVFAGVSRDPDYGLTIAFGMGGIAVEVVRDFALRMLPLREGEAEAMIAETRGAMLLDAFRGRPAADRAALARTLYALSDFAVAHAERIAEIDLNPIKALPRGCVVVDALIVTRQA